MAPSSVVLRQFKEVLPKVSGPETAVYDGVFWEKEKPTRGNCVVISLATQRIVGGKIVSVTFYNGERTCLHFFNEKPDGTEIDLAPEPTFYQHLSRDTHDRCFILSNIVIRCRYQLFVTKIAQELEPNSTERFFKVRRFFLE